MSRRNYARSSRFDRNGCRAGTASAGTSAAEAAGGFDFKLEAKTESYRHWRTPGRPGIWRGGTIALYADAGHEVVILYLNKAKGANQPSSGSGPDRVAEANKACEILKDATRLCRPKLTPESIIDNERYDQFRRVIESRTTEYCPHPMAD